MFIRFEMPLASFITLRTVPCASISILSFFKSFEIIRVSLCLMLLLLSQSLSSWAKILMTIICGIEASSENWLDWFLQVKVFHVTPERLQHSISFLVIVDFLLDSAKDLGVIITFRYLSCIAQSSNSVLQSRSWWVHQSFQTIRKAKSYGRKIYLHQIGVNLGIISLLTCLECHMWSYYSLTYFLLNCVLCLKDFKVSWGGTAYRCCTQC